MTVGTESVDFLHEADPYRRELTAHCYRMLGSVHDAEDLVQETYLRAWKAYDKFENRSSLRTWLYRIATNVCLTALDGRERRPLPAGLGNPDSDPSDPLTEQNEVPWLEPFPDSGDPASIVAAKENVRLALIAALQHLPPRQRAVLILRDVLKWRAAEVAEALGTTTAAVNSVLQRARAQLDQVAPSADEVTEPAEAGQRELLAKYVAAFETKNVPEIVALFTKDAVFDMPPFAAWYRGRENIGRHLRDSCPVGPGEMRLIPVSANGQPGFGTYWMRDGVAKPFNLVVLTLSKDGITHSTSFFDTTLFEKFGLPLELTDETAFVGDGHDLGAVGRAQLGHRA
ncbi:sigma-70 family RNA polymerase sigma factor [Kibdelosporangium phytohabitans]|uniref:RNA polymerase sigma factor n=1 Tax=Kibdelosporangium phytohabitans TaxID=860235 RepID=A0A0N7F2X9_9PSEU|nr:sigma-70 family RNA polymerase sigma factor [Kibdelosporangium phytohabitans]ALG07079.1 RNA polymerase subunit sigma-70 [Kibdelosporangium phytohabitans]MBE1468385.1 RNA polymerase sigma-70 factor (ECF subfamily) [Kibdelosporangium phytohabitans]